MSIVYCLYSKIERNNVLFDLQIMTGIITSHQYSYLCVRTYSTYTRSIRFWKLEAAVKKREKRKSDHRSYRSFARGRRTTTTIQLMFQSLFHKHCYLLLVCLPWDNLVNSSQYKVNHTARTHTLGLARLHIEHTLHLN